MNILLANWTWYPSGGDWTYINSISKLYESKGHTIIPFSVKREKNFPTLFDGYFLNEIDYKNYYNRIPLLKGINSAIKSVYSLEAKRKMQWLIRENRVELAQLNNISNYHTPSIIPVLKKAKIPIVWRILDYRLLCPNSTFLSHGKICESCFRHRYYKCVFKRCKKKSLLASALLAIESYAYSILPFYKMVDAFLFQSEFSRELFVKFGYDIKKTYVFENPFDFSNIQPEFERGDYILFFGRISEEKGILTLLKAMRICANVHLKIVGDGPEYDCYRRYVADNSLTNVSFLGPKWGEDLDPIIKDCSFVVLPSEWYEPSPYAALQAFAYGKPVVASSIGGLRDLVVDKINGLFFQAGDVDGLSRAISVLQGNEEWIKEMGVNARRILEKKHNAEKYYQSTMILFNELMAGKTKA